MQTATEATTGPFVICAVYVCLRTIQLHKNRTRHTSQFKENNNANVALTVVCPLFGLEYECNLS